MRWILVLCLCTRLASLPRGNAQWQAGRSDGPAAQILAAHNRLRASLGIPPLEWSKQLAALARQWAEELLANGTFRPRGDHKFGENLFEMGGRAATPQEVVNAWASEARNYDYRTNRCSARCGHYKQVVWRDTRSVGCGVARGSGREVWVCNYDPLGNLNGERPY